MLRYDDGEVVSRIFIPKRPGSAVLFKQRSACHVGLSMWILGFVCSFGIWGPRCVAYGVACI